MLLVVLHRICGRLYLQHLVFLVSKTCFHFVFVKFRFVQKHRVRTVIFLAKLRLAFSPGKDKLEKEIKISLTSMLGVSIFIF